MQVIVNDMQELHNCILAETGCSVRCIILRMQGLLCSLVVEAVSC